MQETKEQQQFFMRLAIALGEKGRTTAPPNPWVGCLIVRDGESVGEGYHKAPGEPHAELVALKQAGILARRATAYITLEPCAHFGRTAPCVSALIEAGIARVMIPFLDPDPQVSGKGVHALEEAGITVVVGVAAEDASRSLEPYLHHCLVHYSPYSTGLSR
ncbi:MAG: Riboflavin biosynthesis protein RibD [Chlamydiae bacterium]|nr:Riboflavin biosynthesis protein RibD [Chlamydiota bacterium]